MGKEAFDRQGAKIVKGREQGLFDGGSGGGREVVGPAGWLRHDMIDKAELVEVVGRDAQGLGGLGAWRRCFQRIAAQPSGEMTE